MYLTNNKSIVIYTINCSQLAVFLALIIFSLTTNAELKSINDSELSEITGQASISIDKNTYASAGNNISYTRINLGMSIETQLAMDKLEVGTYARNDPKGIAQDSDILIENLALGTIYDSEYFDKNPALAIPLKADGTHYSDGEIVPFKIDDPFIEFAIDDVTGAVVGARIGLGKAEGHLSGIIKSLTGNINVDILDTGDGLKAASSSGNLFDRVVILLAPYLTSGDPLHSKAVLLDANGDPDPIRASMVGIPNGEELVIEDVNLVTRLALKVLSPVLTSNIKWDGKDAHIEIQDCAVLGVNTCFDLTQFETLSIGEITESNGKRYLSGPESGTFLSFQTQNLKWLTKTGTDTPAVEDFINTTTGGFINIPNGLTLNLKESLDGIPRARTEYIDRGVGLF